MAACGRQPVGPQATAQGAPGAPRDPRKRAFLATRAAPGRFFGTATCAVFWGRSHGGTISCATGQLALPRDTVILRTSNLCPSWGPPCDGDIGVSAEAQFSPKSEEMGPCAAQGGDPLRPARRDCAVHTDALPPTPPARARGRNAQQTAPRTSSCSTRVHVARFVPRFSRAKTPSASQTLVFKARGRSQKARKTHVALSHVSSRRHPGAPAGLEPVHRGVFQNTHLRGLQGDIPRGHGSLCKRLAHTAQRHHHFAH